MSFHLADEEGRQVLIDDPGEATVTLSDDDRERTTVSGNAESDDDIRRLCERAGLSPTCQLSRRYTQDIIVPGDRVYVLGEAIERDDPAGHANEDRLMLTHDRSTGELLIADRSQQHLQEQYRNWSALYVVVGLAVAAYCLWAWLTNGMESGFKTAITGALVGLVILAGAYLRRERVAKAIHRFKGDFG